MSRPTEDGLISRFFAPIAGPGGLGLADDAAMFSPEPGHDIVLTVDAVVAGVHFLSGDPPDSIARKALGVNLSDLAAKGADPVGFLLSLALPDDWREEWLAAFAAELGNAAAEWGCPLLGGDTVRAAGPLSLSITAVGQVPEGGMVRRTAAEPGDHLVVSGTIGDATLGLALLAERPAWSGALADQDAEFLVDRYRRPRPRLALGSALRHFARAAMDVSDGLVGDLRKMLRASGVGGDVALDRVPVSAAAGAALSSAPDLLARMMTGGDDYEIVASVPEASLSAFLDAAGQAGVPVASVGRVTPQGSVSVTDRGGEVVLFPSGSFSHF